MVPVFQWKILECSGCSILESAFSVGLQYMLGEVGSNAREGMNLLAIVRASRQRARVFTLNILL